MDWTDQGSEVKGLYERLDHASLRTIICFFFYNNQTVIVLSSVIVVTNEHVAFVFYSANIGSMLLD